MKNNNTFNLFTVNTRIKAGADSTTPPTNDEAMEQFQKAMEENQQAINDFLQQQQPAIPGT